MENNLLKEFEEQREERLLSGPAKRLVEKLKPLSSHVEMYQKRWFWELLQNACDNNESVKVQVEITDGHLYFRHNGKPFTTKDAMNLIFPDSGKDIVEDVNIIGQFGTGFLSTHIVSSKIKVSGILEDKLQDKYPFSFNLDRSKHTDKVYLSEALAKAEQELRDSKKGFIDNEKEFQTEFVYDLSSAYEFSLIEDTIQQGIKFIKSALPYVFTFVSQLQRVEITTDKKTFIFSRLEGDNTGCKYECIGEDPVTKEYIVYSAKTGNTQVALRVQNNEVIKNNEVPFLFCAYPMLGTENFPFPCVINNPEFVPRTERDGIELSENDKVNRSIITEAVKAYSELLKKLCDKDLGKIYNACNLKTGIFEGKDQEWFKKSISDSLKTSILGNEVIKVTGGKKKLNDVYIPYPETEESFNDFFSICERTDFLIPIKEEALNWYQLLNFSVFTNEKFDLKSLVENIKNPATKKLSESLLKETNEIKWLVDLIKYILLFEQQILLQKYALIPVKSNILRTSKQELYWDDTISTELIEIHDLLHNNTYNDILLHSEVEILGEKLWPVDKKKTEKDISETIDQAFKNSGTIKITANFIEALQRLFSWTDPMIHEQLAELFPIFSSNKAKLMLDTLGTDHERNLAFEIIKSDKKEVLSRIAVSSITAKELETIIDNQKEFNLFLKWKNSKVDDIENASESLGDIGEKYLYNWLLNKYKGSSAYEVEWVAKTRQEPNYDFEIRKDGKPWVFVDAKTTNQGISNSDTVPFFMRKGQWEFLPTLDKEQMYFIARIFIENDNSIAVRFLNIKPEEMG